MEFLQSIFARSSILDVWLASAFSSGPKADLVAPKLTIEYLVKSNDK